MVAIWLFLFPKAWPDPAKPSTAKQNRQTEPPVARIASESREIPPSPLSSFWFGELAAILLIRRIMRREIACKNRNESVGRAQFLSLSFSVTGQRVQANRSRPIRPSALSLFIYLIYLSCTIINFANDLRVGRARRFVRVDLRYRSFAFRLVRGLANRPSQGDPKAIASEPLTGTSMACVHAVLPSACSPLQPHPDSAPPNNLINDFESCLSHSIARLAMAAFSNVRRAFR